MEKTVKQWLARIKQQLGSKIHSIEANGEQETVILIEKTDLPHICQFLWNEKKDACLRWSDAMSGIFMAFSRCIMCFHLIDSATS
ncbi:hypothetical protein HNQ34_000205 [Anoxybacillus tepidamans]|uniref:Uncharacterized protein n=1 Tax=Anoxybacteroides tepidamans TaxID=265948 RepID=A0A7W8MTS8_9BACL|nr:hypothetical protein [Anoxybacillus tepidamans]MBB5323128.1 hypothetical protein [Anoxybacillus tepidamans]